MFKFTAKYTDYNDVAKVEDLHFHMTVPEFTDLQFDKKYLPYGGFGAYLEQLVGAVEPGANDGNVGEKNIEIYHTFKELLARSFGRRTEDGSRFIKKPEFLEEFINSPQHEAFFMWFLENPAAHAAEFWTSIIPKNMENVKPMPTAEEPSADTPVNKDPKDMTREELLAAMRDKVSGR